MKNRPSLRSAVIAMALGFLVGSLIGFLNYDPAKSAQLEVDSLSR